MLYNKQKNGWILFLMILAGIVLGGFLGDYLGKLPYLTWLNYGKPFGFNTITLHLSIIVLQFGLNIYINIASIIGIILSIIAYRKI